ncbi:extradiol ring-cleavage dioxygenase [Bacillus suaedaesalsae]|uniref:Extradiol ring-cleavage dioxygenase n=1 Tax=Bacillus suaedaesalsae TaxID=2810349 RepID=A0ABS2DDN3_9BACI|nr:extradiol ring-cleavage dioxygenase [Bacillus suaedaesalsae]MBM6616570.1 extradiol ring-cleavage dioxygenase [Bacillus suaedaesalsae]
MNPFVFSCITSHGTEIIPELQGQSPERMSLTRRNMTEIGLEMEKAKPDAIIVLTPHGTRIAGQFSITDSENMEGTIEENDIVFTLKRRVDRELARKIAEHANELELPVGLINYATASGPYSSLSMDWGVMVPLRFMPNVPIVVINPTRELSYEKHLEFGKAVRNAVLTSNKKIGLVASCDWSHTHNENGPYGYHPAAQTLDEQVLQIVKQNQLEKLQGFDEEFVEAAKPDGIWQALILAGAIPEEERHIKLRSYEAPTYFGLLCASIY